MERLLAAYGIPSAAVELARTPEEAGEVGRRIGFPVALKVASPQISHKSNAGGVLLNVSDSTAAAAGFRLVVQNARAAVPGATILGVHVQRMLPPGQEVIVGAVADPQFGPLVMFGSGGVEVEELRDVAFALAPLSRDDAERILATTWAGRRLAGYRHLPPADRAAVLDILFRLAQLAADIPEIAEIEFNPLRVFSTAQGAVVLDARVRLGAIGEAAVLDKAG